MNVGHVATVDNIFEILNLIKSSDAEEQDAIYRKISEYSGILGYIYPLFEVLYQEEDKKMKMLEIGLLKLILKNNDIQNDDFMSVNSLYPIIIQLMIKEDDLVLKESILRASMPIYYVSDGFKAEFVNMVFQQYLQSNDCHAFSYLLRVLYEYDCPKFDHLIKQYSSHVLSNHYKNMNSITLAIDLLNLVVISDLFMEELSIEVLIELIRGTREIFSQYSRFPNQEFIDFVRVYGKSFKHMPKILPIDEIANEIIGVINNMTDSNWIPFLLLSKLIKYQGDSLKPYLRDFIGFSLDFASIVTINDRDFDYSELSIVLNVVHYCMLIDDSNGFLEYIVTFFEALNPIISLHILRDIIAYLGNHSQFWISSFLVFLQQCLEIEYDSVITSAMACVGEIAFYVGKQYDMSKLIQNMIHYLKSDSPVLIENSLQYLTQVVYYCKIPDSLMIEMFEICFEIIKNPTNSIICSYSLVCLNYLVYSLEELNCILPQTTLGLLYEYIDSGDGMISGTSLLCICSHLSFIKSVDALVINKAIEYILEFIQSQDHDLIVSAYKSIICLMDSEYLSLEPYIELLLIKTFDVMTNEKYFELLNYHDILNLSIVFCIRSVKYHHECILKWIQPLAYISNSHLKFDDPDVLAAAIELSYRTQIISDLDYDDTFDIAFNKCNDSDSYIVSLLLPTFEVLLKISTDLLPEQISSITKMVMGILTNEHACQKKPTSMEFDSTLMVPSISILSSIAHYYSDSFPFDDLISLITQKIESNSLYFAFSLYSPLISYIYSIENPRLIVDSVAQITLNIIPKCSSLLPADPIILLRVLFGVDESLLNDDIRSLLISQLDSSEQGLFRNSMILAISSLLVTYFNNNDDNILIKILGLMPFQGDKAEALHAYQSILRIISENQTIVLRNMDHFILAFARVLSQHHRELKANGVNDELLGEVHYFIKEMISKNPDLVELIQESLDEYAYDRLIKIL